jgi:hypothetical protein
MKRRKSFELEDIVDPLVSEKANLWKDGPLSFLANAHEYIAYRLVTCLNYCLICDKVRSF